MKRLLAAVLALSSLQAAEPERWTDPKAGLSCAVPEGWAFQEFTDGTAIFREKDKKPPAFLNVRKSARKGTLEAYAKENLKELTVPAKDLKACVSGKRKALRASGSVEASGGKLFDLLLFLDDAKGYLLVMLTCLPEDAEKYAPVLDAFAQELRT